MDLTIQNLQKRFGSRVAVDIPSLTIRDAEFFTFVGPSGCGKSTTLNMIAGLEEPSGGTVRHGEQILTGLPPHRRDMAFVFQTYALYPHRTVARNLSFPLELAGVEKNEIRKRVAETAELLGLAPLLDKLPRQLSGGERQRVALGRAIIRQPKLFLFDEPLSNLDAVLRAQMRRELKNLHQRLRTTFIYVTHDQEEALSLSDRVAILRAGRIQQCGPPRELYEEPANEFVASFFGAPPINYVAARLISEGSTIVAQVGERRIRMSHAVHAPPSEIKLGIRPEHLHLHERQAPESWPMRVTRLEPHGGQVYVDLESDGMQLTAVQASEAQWKQGETVHVSVPAERIHLFSNDGERIQAPRHG